MTEPRRPTPDLDAALTDLADHLDWPPTPDIAGRAAARLQAASPSRPRPWMAWRAPRRLALAALAILLLAALALAASPDVRRAIADRLGVRGIDIQQVPALPTLPPTPTPLPSATPIPLGVRLGLGSPSSLAAAQAQIPFTLRQPTLPELGAPDEVYVEGLPGERAVTLVYRARPGFAAGDNGIALLAGQFVGQTDQILMGKQVASGSTVEAVRVNGERGFWITGAPHAFFYRDAQGNIREETLRLAGNVLIWEQAGLTLRLEGALSREAALRVAESVRPWLQGAPTP